MDIRELRYFAAVYRERNLTAAAKRCFISQPSISAAITNLEAELGTTLFIRHKKGMAPTHRPSNSMRWPAASSTRRTPRETCSGNHHADAPDAWPDAHARHEPNDLAAEAADRESEIALRLVGIDEAADARIISKNIANAEEHFVPLWSERYVAALPPSHPLTLKERLRTADFAGVPMIDRCHCEQSEFFGRVRAAQPAAIARIGRLGDGAGRGRRRHRHRSRGRGARQSRCRGPRDRGRGEAQVGLAYSSTRAAVGRAEGLHRDASDTDGKSKSAPSRRHRRER